MKKIDYFKFAFGSMSAGITTFIIVEGLFTLDFGSWTAIWHLVAKALFVGIVSGLVLGLLNMVAKFAPRQRADK